MSQLFSGVDVRILSPFERSFQFFQLLRAESCAGSPLFALQRDSRLRFNVRQIAVARRSSICFFLIIRIKEFRLESLGGWISFTIYHNGQHVFNISLHNNNKKRKRRRAKTIRNIETRESRKTSLGPLSPLYIFLRLHAAN